MSTAHRIFEVIREAKPPQTKEELIALLEASLALLKLSQSMPSSACERAPWCVLQVGHEGICSTEFAFTRPDVEDDAPCELCGLVNAHDFDVHAEADLDRAENREWDRCDGGAF